MREGATMNRRIEEAVTSHRTAAYLLSALALLLVWAGASDAEAVRH